MLTYKCKRHLLFVGQCSDDGWLQRKCRWIGSVSVMRQASLAGVLVLFIAFLLIGCASTGETLSDPSSAQSGAAVPGEKMPDDERYAPGPMGSSNVRF